MEAAPAVARLLADELGRDDRWVAAQVRDYRELARGWLLPVPAWPACDLAAPLVA